MVKQKVFREAAFNAIQAICTIITTVILIWGTFVLRDYLSRDYDDYLYDKGYNAYKDGNYLKAEKILSSVELDDNSHAKFVLGYMYTHGSEDGRLKPDIVKGTRLYAEAYEMSKDEAIYLNYLYNTVNYSGCTYEIAEIIQSAIYEGNWEVCKLLCRILGVETANNHQVLDALVENGILENSSRDISVDYDAIVNALDKYLLQPKQIEENLNVADIEEMLTPCLHSSCHGPHPLEVSRRYVIGTYYGRDAQSGAVKMQAKYGEDGPYYVEVNKVYQILFAKELSETIP